MSSYDTSGWDDPFETGGWWADVTEVDGVTVTGTTVYPITDDPFNGWADGSDQGSGNGGTPTPELDCECACDASGPSPDGVPLDTIRNEAQEIISELLADETRSMNIEWGSILYIDVNGVVGHTPIISGTNDSIDWNGAVSMVPNGATIIGTLHSHPEEEGLDQRFPSDDDWAVNQELIRIGLRSSRIDTDPNLMTYIFDVEGNDLFEYDNEDRDKITPGEEIGSDC